MIQATRMLACQLTRLSHFSRIGHAIHTPNSKIYSDVYFTMMPIPRDKLTSSHHNHHKKQKVNCFNAIHISTQNQVSS